MILPSSFHSPVLLPEVIFYLEVTNGKKYIDATLGGAGYSEAIEKRGGKVLGIDRDPEAIAYAQSRHLNALVVQGNFADIKRIAMDNGFVSVDGIVFDLGMSTHQLERSGRGFTYKKDEYLDMRMDPKETLTAASILNTNSKEGLYEIFSSFSEDLNSRAIAAAIVRSRSLNGEIRNTGELVEIVRSVVRNRRNKNATLSRIFQALRIAVNDEINNLKNGIRQGIELLSPKGRICIVAYHSLEDRVAKKAFEANQNSGQLRIVTNKPKRALENEIRENPKARSALLRVGEKL